MDFSSQDGYDVLNAWNASLAIWAWSTTCAGAAAGTGRFPWKRQFPSTAKATYRWTQRCRDTACSTGTGQFCTEQFPSAFRGGISNRRCAGTGQFPCREQFPSAVRGVGFSNRRCAGTGPFPWTGQFPSAECETRTFCRRCHEGFR